ncbi:hypothetical protein AXF42_Ash001669 [Apostasia shenzhenica]|uniref:Uncharacterized protein n=1 Tax=Apostasia shenzhenica TaxID=1088818 RepID=A0A2I0AAW1_9ASPA|nr:hypothetical protein AXF42_Ash001669 [Apostasia shenzhenica]
MAILPQSRHRDGFGPLAEVEVATIAAVRMYERSSNVKTPDSIFKPLRNLAGQIPQILFSARLPSARGGS